MKKTIFMLVLCTLSSFIIAQNTKFISTMEKTLEQKKSAKEMTSLQQVANTFERIANAEKEEWLPPYYVALCNFELASMSMRDNEVDKLKPFIDKAQAAIDQCKALAENEAEVYALQGYIYMSRIWENPMTAGGVYSPKAHEAFAKSIAMQANNPRAHFGRAQLVFYTPAFWGGGADKAHPDLVTADKLYKNFEPATSIHPNWGAGSNTYLLKKAEEAMKNKPAESDSGE